MKMKTKILVALAFIVAAFYTLEVILTVVNQGVVGPVFLKAGIVAAAIYYAVSAIKKTKSPNAQVDTGSTK